MIDFTSSLYLGMKQSSAELLGWQQLTTGVPAAVYEFNKSKQISQQIAQMQALEKGICAPSTLHLYWDLFGFLCNQRITLFIDERIYPVSKYGIERLIINRIPVYFFRHLDANHLYESVHSKLRKFTKPVILTDGWCPPCGRPAPINDYLKILQPFEGYIIIDDTQAFGILGEKETEKIYGNGGGGLLKWLNVQDHHVITIISLAKAFGVPIAIMSGNRPFVSAFIESSGTRVNSSPVSMAHLNAALNGLESNYRSGDQRRKKLLSNVLLIRNQLKQSGIKLGGGVFPVQTIINLGHQQITYLFKKLNESKIKTVLIEEHIEHRPVISILIRSDHSTEEIQTFTYVIQKLIPRSLRVALSYELI